MRTPLTLAERTAFCRQVQQSLQVFRSEFDTLHPQLADILLKSDRDMALAAYKLDFKRIRHIVNNVAKYGEDVRTNLMKIYDSEEEVKNANKRDAALLYTLDDLIEIMGEFDMTLARLILMSRGW